MALMQAPLEENSQLEHTLQPAVVFYFLYVVEGVIFKESKPSVLK